MHLAQCLAQRKCSVRVSCHRAGWYDGSYCYLIFRWWSLGEQGLKLFLSSPTCSAFCPDTITWEREVNQVRTKAFCPRALTTNDERCHAVIAFCPLPVSPSSWPSLRPQGHSKWNNRIWRNKEGTKQQAPASHLFLILHHTGSQFLDDRLVALL